VWKSAFGFINFGLTFSISTEYMLKKVISILLVLAVVNLAVIPAVFASDNKAEKEAKFVEKVKTEIAKLGVGTDAKIQVKLKDGTKLKGYVSEINDEGFVVTDNDGKSTSIPYNNAKQVKGNNLNTKAIVAIGIAVAIIIIVFVGAKAAK
jgi:hypothetical protein